MTKIFISLAFGLLFLFSYPPFANFLVENLENKYDKFASQEDITYIHVLGSGHTTDSIQPISSQLSSSSLKRVVEGILIHRQVDGSKLIFTGYEGDTKTTNAEMNAALAMALGVKKENIITNGEPRDTSEEAIFAKELIQKQKFVLVTSASHMPRAMQLFRKLGLNPIPAPTDFCRSECSGLLSIPGIRSFGVSQRAIHEYLGIVWNSWM